MNTQVMIDSRFCGEANYGNGGYTCGLLAKFINGTAEVTLRKPPPLNKTLEVKQIDEGSFTLSDNDVRIAEAVHAELDLDPPIPPAIEVADSSTLKAEDIKDHYYPTCFVCGPKREEGDGLRIFPGPVAGQNYIAATWTPGSSLSDETGHIKTEIIWSALDSPGAWAIILEEMRYVILGRLVVQIFDRVKLDEKCIVIGWKISEERRKIYAGTALYSASGQLYGKGKATWIELKEP